MRSAVGGGAVGRALATAWTADRGGVLRAFLLQVLGASSALGVVLASKLAIDGLVSDEGGVPRLLVVALALLAVTTALASSISVFQQQQQRLLGEKVGQYIWRRLLRACVAVDLVTWESPAFADRLERVRSNALQRPTTVVGALMGLAGSAVGIVGMVAVLLAIEPLLIPVLIAAGVPSVLFSRIASRAEFRFASGVNAGLRRRIYLKQLMTGRPFAAEIRAFDAGPHLVGRHDAEDVAYLGALESHVRFRQRVGVLSTLASAVALAVALLLIVLLLDRGRLSLAEAGAAAIAARLLGGQLSAVFTAVGTLVESGPFLRDLEDFLAGLPQDSSRGRRGPLRDALSVRGVSFTYGSRDTPAVKDVDLDLAPGQVVAVVGENGSGKTTLAKIVAGLYAADTGTVLWDGEELAREDLRARVSAVFQDFVRYQLSAADNVAIADTAAPHDRARVERAAIGAGIDAALGALPRGYDTHLGLELSEGSDLSGGQWQRVALARALYRDASVIVLDEPTAALDPRAEHELFSDVRRMLEGRAALLISHRWSSVRLADHIYVMDAGRVIEHGTHDELLARQGRYAELYTLQAAAYLD
ncbi:ABC transporter ATP-binding protein [Nocardioides sp. Leaf307]|uniref:ABC transporter ATP-binding protein n=1 Tax=Nocardioides sp. Leaf307 TaxID=1736331 RepID=UPI000702FB99|nr:ABC transporter ATP-binding protein [Nocardioides sp. Leaf307]KQQ42943.1 ABC transporter ATP-binding protein [Nocardioides sp. Leaf307]